MTNEQKEYLFNTIRTIKDFPKEGINFYDITTLINNKEAYILLMDHLEERYKDFGLDYIAGVDSRGFIFGAALADRLKIGFVPIRKKGKLPAQTFGAAYDLEYGSNEIEIHKDAFNNEKNPRVLLIDDILVTGGTATCAAQLVKDAGGQLVETCFLLILEFLNGRKKLEEKSSIYAVLSV